MHSSLVLLALLCGLHHCAHASPLTGQEICSSPPQEIAETLANTFVEGGGLAAAEAEAITDAGRLCCSKLRRAMAAAKAVAETNNQLDPFSKATADASANAGIRSSCARNILVNIVATVSTGSNGQPSAKIEGTVVGGGATSGSLSGVASLRTKPDGTVQAQASGDANVGK